jgi:hypothetical protein
VAVSDSIEQAIEALAQLRELVQEAHGVTKDLRLAIKEAKQVNSELPSQVAMHLDRAVATGLKEYTGALDKAIKNAEAVITRRFDVLGAIFMGEDPESVAEGRESLEDLINRVGRRRHVR